MLVLLNLSGEARALDIGCGKAEVLLRLVERYGLQGVGVDLSPGFMREARCQADLRLALPARLELWEMRGEAFDSPAIFDLAIAWEHLGFTEGIPDPGRLRTFCEPRGLLFIGPSHWREEPDAEYDRYECQCSENA